MVKLVIAAPPRKPASPKAEIALARPVDSGNMNRQYRSLQHQLPG
jgi:hypothetical protein